MASDVKPLTMSSLSRMGCPTSFIETAATKVRISAHRDRRFRDRDRTFRLMMTAHFGAT
jgi:hypothetical protein